MTSFFLVPTIFLRLTSKANDFVWFQWWGEQVINISKRKNALIPELQFFLFVFFALKDNNGNALKA